MMKRWISMLLALMLLMLGMATAEDAADDAWEYELVGRAIELVRQMDAQERGRLFEDTLNITEVACTETPQPIDRGMPRQAFISVNGTDKSASVLFFALMMMDASADTDATDETENAYLRIVERTFAVSPEFGMDAQETSAAASAMNVVFMFLFLSGALAIRVDFRKIPVDRDAAVGDDDRAVQVA